MKTVTFGQLWAVLGLILLSSTLQVNAKEYYKWVDAKGVTTYSAPPPPPAQKTEPQLDPVKNNSNTPAQQSTAPKEPKATTLTATPTTISKPVSNATASNLTAASGLLIPVKNCNGVRCWDTKGKSYNLVAGTTYLSAHGGKCQKIANNMQCNK